MNFYHQVPGCEGKAGMAAIEDPNQNVYLVDLLSKLRRALPFYAIPVFVRLVKKIETTGTFKLPKVTFSSVIHVQNLTSMVSFQVALQKQGYDPQIVSDPMYYLSTKENRYVKLSTPLFEDISNGQIRF